MRWATSLVNFNLRTFLARNYRLVSYIRHFGHSVSKWRGHEEYIGFTPFQCSETTFQSNPVRMSTQDLDIVSFSWKPSLFILKIYVTPIGNIVQYAPCTACSARLWHKYEASEVACH